MASGLSLNIDTTKSEFQNPMVELRQGDGNYQSLRVTVTSNGEPLMLDGWTVNFMGTTAGGHKIVDADIHIINASNGVFDYTPTKAWGQDIGEFDKAYFKFTNGDEAASGANFRVKVFEAVDLTDEEAGDYISVVDVMIDKIKTDMDNKLADTQTTLTNTQNQANTVQSNVNDLNTNVNELKSQNNNIRTSDNTWTGNNTFNNTLKVLRGSNGGIDGGIKTIALDKKISEIVTNASDYIGVWAVNPSVTTDIPEQSWGILSISNFGNDSGVMTFLGTSKTVFYVLNFQSGVPLSWQKIPYNYETVHNTGNETIAGDKTLTGATAFTQPIIGSLKTRDVPFTDFNDVAKNMVQYAGTWVVGNQSIANSPIANYYTVTVTPAIADGGSGYIELVPFVNGSASKYIAVVGSQTLSPWKTFAFNDSVVHNTGDETIGGNKSITGSLTINDANPLKVKQSSTVEFDSWQSSKMKATRFGNIVALRYSVLPNNNNTITKNQTSSVVIPQGYRPMEQWNMAVGGTSSGSNVLVNPDGTLTSGWQDVQYAGMMTAMYFTTDPFPS